MALNDLFHRFLNDRPVCVMARAVLERIFNADRLEALFERTAVRQYTRDLLFSSQVELMSQVVLGIQPSVHAAWQKMEDQIGVSASAVYDKINQVEKGVCAELVRDSARQAEPVIRQLRATFPAELRGYRTKYLDGNHLSATEHRLKELRSLSAAPLPGKALVVLDQETGLNTDVFLCEDGHAQERSLLGEVLTTVQERDLWIADRNFCTIGFMAGIAGKQAGFVFRHHGALKGKLAGKRWRCGRTDTGEVFEQRLEFLTENGNPLSVRRVTICLDQATEDGDEEIHLLTNLPRREVRAEKVAEMYRKRWTIEKMFHAVTETLTCEMPSLGYPRAALFGFCLALVAYNAVAVLRAALHSEHGAEEVEQKVSSYYLALEISQVYDGMMVALPSKEWQRFGLMSGEEFAWHLKQMARKVSLNRYRKHPRGAKKKPPKRTSIKNGAHVSTAKEIEKRNL